MNLPDFIRKDPIRFKYNLSKRTAIVAGIFAVIFSILLIANYIQTKSVDPLNSEALSQFLRQMQKNPDDTALKEQIRALDLLARKAYFTNQWQVRTGSTILFVAVLILLISLKTMTSVRRSLPDLEAHPGADKSWSSNILARKYLIFGGLGMFAVAFLLGVLSESELTDYGTTAQPDAADDYPTVDEIRENWPSFRGPGGNGVAYDTNMPRQWNGKEGENVLWKTVVPRPGFNSPVFWNGRIFLSGADEDNQTVFCFDANSGNIVWQKDVNDIPGSPEERPDVTKDTGYAAPTLTTDGQRVFAIFATGDLVCFDFDGNRVWAQNLGVPENHYGHSSSLFAYNDLLLVQFDHGEGGHLKAFKTATGATVYDTPRDVQISWASPILVDTGSRTEIILTSNPYVISYDPQTGSELWRVECMEGEVAPSPAYADGMVFVVNEFAILAGIKLGDKPEVAWEYEDDLSEVSSPVATNDNLILPSSYGTVTCLDAKSGEKYWSRDFDDGFYSSPVLVGDLVYLMDLKGVMHIFKADKTFELVNECELGEDAFATPAYVNGHIYIRGEDHLFCIGK